MDKVRLGDGCPVWGMCVALHHGRQVCVVGELTGYPFESGGPYLSVMDPSAGPHDAARYVVSAAELTLDLTHRPTFLYLASLVFKWSQHFQNHHLPLAEADWVAVDEDGVRFECIRSVGHGGVTFDGVHDTDRVDFDDPSGLLKLWLSVDPEVQRGE